MKFNIVSNLHGGAVDPAALWSYNEIIAFNLKGALEGLGHEVVLVGNRMREFSKADHTIVTSSLFLGFLREDRALFKSLRAATAGRLCLWLDSDFNGWYTEAFDRVLTVCRQSNRCPELYRWVGWAADSELFCSEQLEPAVSVDCYMRGFYGGKFDAVYDLIEQAVKEAGLPVLQPVYQYNQGRIKWLKLAALFRKSSYYVLTQPAYWGLTNIEAAACGAVLLVHKSIDLPHTWPTRLNYRTYETKAELVELLHSPVDVAENRRVAMVNTWSGVASRVVEAVA